MHRRLLPLLIALVAVAAPAATIEYIAPIAPLNGSGVAGHAMFSLTDTTSLSVHISATGLEPNRTHPAHLHGKIGPGGTLLPPSPPADIDGDNYIETPEAQLAVGPPIIPLGEFFVGASGTLNVTQTYDLTNAATFAAGATAANLQPFQFLTFELHGMTVPEGAGAGTPHEVNGTGGYKMILPVGGGQPAPIPEPATVAVVATGLALFALRNRGYRSARS